MAYGVWRRAAQSGHGRVPKRGARAVQSDHTGPQRQSGPTDRTHTRQKSQRLSARHRQVHSLHCLRSGVGLQALLRRSHRQSMHRVRSRRLLLLQHGLPVHKEPHLVTRQTLSGTTRRLPHHKQLLLVQLLLDDNQTMVRISMASYILQVLINFQYIYIFFSTKLGCQRKRRAKFISYPTISCRLT